MEEPGLSGYGTGTILDVLGVDICRRAILDQVPIKDIIRSERVSRRWQHIVLIYLQNCRNLTLEVYEYDNIIEYEMKKYGHRSVRISTRKHDNYPLPIFSKTLEKLGSLTVRLKTNLKEELYESITSHCPYLRHIELDYFFCTDISEKGINDLIRNKDLETMKLTGLKNLSGNFLNSLKSDCIRSLSIARCRCSQLDYYFYKDSRHVTCLCVNSSLLKGLAGCSNLEYLNISGCSLSDCSQGLVALIRRPGVTWLCLGFIKNMPYEELKQLRIITELERCGCNYVTPEMLKEASLASRGQKHALEFIVNYPAKEECSELKIILGEFFESQKMWSGNED